MATAKQIRQQLLLGQEQMASLLGISRSQLSRAEQKREPMPQKAILMLGIVEACMTRAKQGNWPGKQVNAYSLALQVLQEMEAMPAELIGPRERAWIALTRLHYQQAIQ